MNIDIGIIFFIIFMTIIVCFSLFDLILNAISLSKQGLLIETEIDKIPIEYSDGEYLTDILVRKNDNYNWDKIKAVLDTGSTALMIANRDCKVESDCPDMKYGRYNYTEDLDTIRIMKYGSQESTYEFETAEISIGNNVIPFIIGSVDDINPTQSKQAVFKTFHVLGLSPVYESGFLSKMNKQMMINFHDKYWTPGKLNKTIATNIPLLPLSSDKKQIFPIVKGFINGTSVDIMIDTGCTESYASEEDIKKFNLNKQFTIKFSNEQEINIKKAEVMQNIPFIIWGNSAMHNTAMNFDFKNNLFGFILENKFSH